MNRVLLLLLVSTFLGNVAFSQMQGQNSQDSNERTACDELSSYVNQLTTDECTALLDALRQHGVKSAGRRTTVTPTSYHPITSGKKDGKNITVYLNPADDKIYFEVVEKIGASVKRGDAVNLNDHTVEIEFVEEDKFNIGIIGGDAVTGWDQYPTKISNVKTALDCKLIPKFQGTDVPAFVGINDARGNVAGKGVSAVMDVVPFPNERRIRLTQVGNDLLVGGSTSVRKIYDNNMDPKKVGEICWGVKMDEPMKLCQ